MNPAARTLPITVEPLPTRLCTPHMLGAWVISGPFHPAWSQWLATLVHLRGEIDGDPAVFQFAGATHELAIQSIDPGYPLDLGADPPSFRCLVPPDVVQQFTAANDAAALRRIEELLNYVHRGVLSPDQDYRRAWWTMLGSPPSGLFA